MLASCNIWEPEPSILHDMCIYIDIDIDIGIGIGIDIDIYYNISELESPIWHAICKLLIVVGCWLLVVVH